MAALKHWLLQIALALIIFFGFLRPYVVEAFRIPTPSMESTLLVGDHILVLKALYGQRVPYADVLAPPAGGLRGEPGMGRLLPACGELHRGDIVVFRYPVDLERDFIKRCVALPGDTVLVRNDTLYVNGSPSEYATGFQDRMQANPIDASWPASLRLLVGRVEELRYDELARGCVMLESGDVAYVVPEGCCFAMGDNRDHSNDSRVWGPLSLDLIKGRALVTYWSWMPGEGLPKLDRVARVLR
ncbi:signal peptidase I [Candidatus Fermentibacterales bacterium]|nr:signal peptidase I [Candidatus Fermentibacterales bacterium]